MREDKEIKHMALEGKLRMNKIQTEIEVKQVETHGNNMVNERVKLTKDLKVTAPWTVEHAQ